MSPQETIEKQHDQDSPFDKIASEATTGGVLGAIGGAVIGGIAGGPSGAFMGAAIGAGVSAVAVDYVAFEEAETPIGHDVLSNVHEIEGSPADALFPTKEYNEVIRKRAFEIWNRRGQPTGTAEEDWQEAKRQIDLRHGLSDMAYYGH